jgi:hypothetical protein
MFLDTISEADFALRVSDRVGCGFSCYAKEFPNLQAAHPRTPQTWICTIHTSLEARKFLTWAEMGARDLSSKGALPRNNEVPCQLKIRHGRESPTLKGARFGLRHSERMRSHMAKPGTRHHDTNYAQTQPNGSTENGQSFEKASHPYLPGAKRMTRCYKTE